MLTEKRCCRKSDSMAEPMPTPVYSGPEPEQKFGFEAFFERQMGLSGPRRISAKDTKGGARFGAGPFKGMTMGEAYEWSRDQYAKMGDAERRVFEDRANMRDVRSAREMESGGSGGQGDFGGNRRETGQASNFITAAEEREQAASRAAKDVLDSARKTLSKPNPFDPKNFSGFSSLQQSATGEGFDFGREPDVSSRGASFAAPISTAPPTKLSEREQATTGMKYLGRFADTGKELYDDTRMNEDDLGGPGSYQSATINSDRSVTRDSYRADRGTFTSMTTNAQTGANAGTILTAKGGGGYGFSGRFEDLSPAQQASMIAAGYVHDPSKSGTIDGKPAAQAIAEARASNEAAAGKSSYAGPVPRQKKQPYAV
jgi:hypothetical protein